MYECESALGGRSGKGKRGRGGFFPLAHVLDCGSVRAAVPSRGFDFQRPSLSLRACPSHKQLTCLGTLPCLGLSVGVSIAAAALVAAARATVGVTCWQSAPERLLLFSECRMFVRFVL